MHTCMNMTCAYSNIYTCIYIDIYAYICVHTYMNTYIFCLYIYIYIYMYVVCIRICLCVCMYIYVWQPKPWQKLLGRPWAVPWALKGPPGIPLGSSRGSLSG